MDHGELLWLTVSGEEMDFGRLYWSFLVITLLVTISSLFCFKMLFCVYQ